MKQETQNNYRHYTSIDGNLIHYGTFKAGVVMGWQTNWKNLISTFSFCQSRNNIKTLPEYPRSSRYITTRRRRSFCRFYSLQD